MKAYELVGFFMLFCAAIGAILIKDIQRENEAKQCQETIYKGGQI